MGSKILIATPVRSFGELILQSLQELDYHPFLVAGSAEAVTVARDEKCSLTVLDCQMPDPGTAELVKQLRANIKNLRIVFIHLDDSCEEPDAIMGSEDISLPQPFYLPDLLSAVEGLVNTEKPSVDEPVVDNQISEIPSELAWLEDVNRAAQYLTRLSLEANAQAALIIRQTQMWAYAGQLPQSAAEELTQFIGQHWANGDGSDLARFIRLDSTSSEYMLYATNLGSGFVLALAFETEMPFSEMRAQAGKLARRLTSPPQELPSNTDVQEPGPRETISPEVRPQETARYVEIDDYSADDWVPEDECSSDDEVSPSGESDDWQSDPVLIARQQAMLEELLATLDIPDPDGASEPIRVRKETPVPDQHINLRSQETENPSELQISEPATLEQQDEQSQPEIVTQVEVQLEPSSPALHDLAYACVLIPRLSEHHLTGDLTDLLNRAMARFAVAFGWRLEHLAIRPQYLHWVVSVGPTVPAADVIQEIRQRTSVLIFDEFSRLARENPSGDFWAPGFMVIHGRRSLAGELVQDFIRQTRLHQGIE